MQTNTARELLLVDARLADLTMLLANVRDGVEARLIADECDGVAAIAAALNEDVAAVHVVAHGQPGQVRLGSGVLHDGTAPHLPRSGVALNLYACHAGAEAAGASLLNAVRTATGGAVSAATGLVGHGSQGGTWVLDFLAGRPGASMPFTSGVVHWPHVLATITGTSGDDTLNGTSGNDVIAGGQGDDALSGGDGDDTFVYDPGNGSAVTGDGSDTIDGGDGTDTLRINRLTSEQNWYDIVASDDDAMTVHIRNHTGPAHDAIEAQSVERLELNLTDNDWVSLRGDLSADEVEVIGSEGGNSLFTFQLSSDTQVNAYLDAGNDSFYAGTHAVGVNVDGGEGTDTVEYIFANGSVDIDLDAGTAIRQNGDVTDIILDFENATGGGYADTIGGTDGANVLRGDGGNDVIDGRGGDDQIDGGSGNDTLKGGAGADQISGGDGNDTIDGGAGSDQIYAGDGNDSISITSGNGGSIAGGGSDTIDGGAGTDTLTVSRLTSGRNDIDVTATAGGFDVTFRTTTGATPHTTVTASNVEAVNVAMANNERVSLNGNLSGVTNVAVTGTSGANTLSVAAMTSATAVNAQLSGGNDTFLGGAHATGVNVDGGTGTDHADYSGIAGPVVIDLAAGTATRNGTTDSIRNFENATGTAGNDTIRGTTGRNVIDGGAGDDLIVGLGGDDTLIGGDGSDTLVCGGGNDVLIGGNGDDVYVIDGSVDIVEGPGGGIDTVRVGHTYVLHDGVDNVVVTSPIVSGGGAGVTITGHGGDNVFYSNGGGLSAGGNGNTFIGGGGADTYYINGGDTVLVNGGRAIVHGAGSSTIIGGPGADDIECHGDGNDTIIGGKGDDLIAGGNGNDTFLYTVGDGNDRIDGGTETGTAYPDVDRLIVTSDGESRAFTIAKAASGVDIVSGVNGDDVLVGYTGTDAAQSRMDEVEYIEINAAGGGALDVTVGDLSSTALIGRGVVVNSGSANDIIDVSGASGGRTVIVNDADPVSAGDTDLVRVGGSRSDYAISLNNGLYSFLHVVSGAVVLEARNVETFHFAGEGVTVGVADLPIRTGIGTSGNDIIRGTPGNDTIDGGDGDDIIIGAGGDDVLIGGNGNDTIYCGGGDDVLIGGDGDDLYVIDGSATIVEVDGGGIDTVHTTQSYELHGGVEHVRVIAGPNGTGGQGVTITGNGGNNTFIGLGGGGGVGGGTGNVFIGGGGEDTFYINGGDTVRTGGSHRVIVHGAGSTTIIGGDGDEIIECHGSGNDTILGGRGDDTIYGGDGDDTFLYTVGDGRDRIDGGTETGTTYPHFDRFIATSDAENRSFVISRAGSGTDIPAGVNATDVLFGYTGTDAAQSRMDEVEYIELNAADGGALNVTIGNLTDTALAQRAIVVNSGSGNDIVDVSGASGGRTIVFNDSDVTASGDTDLARLSGVRADYTITFASGTYSFLHTASGVLVLEATNVETFFFAGDSQTFTAANLLNTDPSAVDDSAAVTEDAVANTATGNVLSNDSANDPAPDTITVTGAAAGNTNAVLTGSVGSVLNGVYGTLTIAANGSYTYTLDNTRFATNELTAGQVAHDVFSYTVSDSYGATSTAQIDVAVTGSDDGTPFNPNIQLVSASATGLLGNGHSYAASISQDGRYVTFHSVASNLVSGDTAAADIFVKDLITGTITKIAGTALTAASTNPALNTVTSADGKWQTFFVADGASGVPGDSNGVYDVFAKNLQTGAVYLVSKGVSGGFGNGDSTFDASSLNVISGDGRTIVFQSTASNLVTSDTNGSLDVLAADNSDGSRLAGTTGNDGALNGTALDDRIAGLDGADTINAGAGNDRIWGDAGNDIINAGDGNDVIYVASGDGNDTIDGGAGYDTVWMTGTATTIQANSLTSIEAVWGGGTNDVIAVNGTADFSAMTLTGVEFINGSDGNDTITGSAGNDSMFGGLGANTLSGGDGNDTFRYGFRPSGWSELWSLDVVTGGSGHDRLVGDATYGAIGLKSISGIEEISANGYTGVRILGTDSAETFDFTGVSASSIWYTALHGGDDTVILGSTVGTGAGNGFGDIAGGAGNDTFVVDGTGYRIFGGGNDGSAEAGFADVIKAKGNDAIIGLNHVAGIETITADGYSNVTIVGTGGDDALHLGNTSIIGIASIDLGAGSNDVIGVNGALDLSAMTLTGVEFINGSDGNDTITGSAGNDSMFGGLGANTLSGGDGNDTFRYGFRPSGWSELWSSDVVTGGSGHDRLVGDATYGAIGLKSISGIEEISANGYTGVRILGTDSAETFDFTGVSASSIWYTALHGGDDTVILGSTVGTGAGNGFGDIAGGAGNDTFVVDGTGYRIFGGGNDGSAEAGFADVIKAKGNDAIIGLNHVAGIETITADGYSNVTIVGTGGDDTINLTGTTLTGIAVPIDLGAGNDTFTGTATADVFIGGLGADTLYGGAGNDTFRYTAVAESWLHSADYLADFAAGDVIDLNLIDASDAAGGNQAFTWRGANAFTGFAGELRYEMSGGYTHIYGDTNGDMAIDLYIAVAGHRTMTTSDFVL